MARACFDMTEDRPGKDRVGLIGKAFRPDGRGQFRGAPAGELRARLSYYHDIRPHLFYGPHYVPDRVIEALASHDD